MTAERETSPRPRWAVNIGRLRDLRCLSQEGAAESVGVAARTWQRWESGANKPRPNQLAAICRLFDVAMTDLERDDEDVNANRRQVLQLAGLLGLGALGGDFDRFTAALSSMRVDGQAIEDLQGIMDSLSLRSHTDAPALLLPTVRTHQATILTLLREHQTPSVERALQGQAAQAGRLAGWLDFLLDNRSAAEAEYARAGALAVEAGDDTLVARVLVSRSLTVSTVSQSNGAEPGTMPLVLEMLREAIRRAGPLGAPRLTSWLHERLAEELAADGQYGAALHELDTAERILGAGPRFEGDLLPTGWDMYWHSAYRGTVARLGGRPEEAIRHLEAALEATGPDMGYDRCVMLTSLGAAYTTQGDNMDLGIGHLTEALSLAQRHKLPGRKQRILAVRRGLPSSEPAVQRLDEQLRIAS